MAIRPIFLTLLAAVGLTGCETLLDELLSDSDPAPVVYVREPAYPVLFDPYYNQPKIYRQPYYYESTTKKTKGDKVFKTKTVRNEYGQTIYKETTSKKKKKK